MAVVKYKTKLYKPRQVSCILAPLFCKVATKLFVFQGVCSTWIASLEPSKGRNIDTEVVFFAVVDFFFLFRDCLHTSLGRSRDHLVSTATV